MGLRYTPRKIHCLSYSNPETAYKMFKADRQDVCCDWQQGGKNWSEGKESLTQIEANKSRG